MITLTADRPWTDRPSGPFILGHFIESGFGRQVNGLWSEMLYNRAFRSVPPYAYATWEWLGFTEEYYNENAPFWHSGYEEHDWQFIGQPETEHTVGTHTFKGLTSLVVTNPTADKACGLFQEGIHLQAGRTYRFSLFAGHKGEISEAGLNGFGDMIHSEEEFPLTIRLGSLETCFQLTTVCSQRDWVFTAKETEIVPLSLEFDWPGGLVLCWSSLKPEDNLGGWRRDVVEKLREIHPAVVRFPGGCFVSFYNWESSIGDPNTREPMPSFYWGGLEDNDVGLDEFMHLSQLAGFEPQICFNMMSSTPHKARQLVEYLNGTADTTMGRLRHLNGHVRPYGVRFFEMENEPGRKWTAKQYAEQCVAFAQEMRLADPDIELMLAAYAYPPEALAGMLELAGGHIDYVIYRRGDPDFVARVLPVIRAYNRDQGTDIRLVNTEWLASCASPEPFEDPAIPTNFRWHGEITNDYRTVLSFHQIRWHYALNAAHRLLDYISYGGDFYLANFNNLCNTWGQNVIEATKDSSFLSCVGQVFAFMGRHYSPCYASIPLVEEQTVYALFTRDLFRRQQVFLINHGTKAQTIALPPGDWRTAEGICAPERLSQVTEADNPIMPCSISLQNNTLTLPPLSLVCVEA